MQIKKNRLIEIIREEVKNVLKEYTDVFGDDERQFDMSFAFKANSKSDVINQFNKAVQTDENWSNIKNIQEWIDNVGFKNADEAFDWLENMYDASKIQPGNAIALQYSQNGWILAAKDGSQIREFITSDNELEILHNAAQDINRDIFNNRGQYNAQTYELIVRDKMDDVLDDLERRTDVKKQFRGFRAGDDEAKEYYQLPEYNVAITFDKYGVTRGSIIRFLSFDGEYPERKMMQ